MNVAAFGGAVFAVVALVVAVAVTHTKPGRQ